MIERRHPTCNTHFLWYWGWGFGGEGKDPPPLAPSPKIFSLHQFPGETRELGYGNGLSLPSHQKAYNIFL